MPPKETQGLNVTRWIPTSKNSILYQLGQQHKGKFLATHITAMPISTGDKNAQILRIIPKGEKLLSDSEEQDKLQVYHSYFDRWEEIMEPNPAD